MAGARRDAFFPRDDGRPTRRRDHPAGSEKLTRADSVFFDTFYFSPRPTQAIAEGKRLESEDARFTIHHAPFGCMDRVLAPLGVRPAGVFLDLGISSPQ